MLLLTERSFAMGAVRRGLAGLGVGFFLLTGAWGSKPVVAPPPSADVVLTQAQATAKAEQKKILLVFHASWCGPCHMFEKFLDEPQVHSVMEKSFVIVQLDVFENEKDKLHASSPGGELEMGKLGGRGQGVPYFAMLDETGEWIADSKMPAGDGPPENLGYPSGSAQIDWFIHMVKKAAPAMPTEDVKTLRDFLEKHGSL
jgi:thiol-disulfide isomerase/thioredoxin